MEFSTTTLQHLWTALYAWKAGNHLPIQTAQDFAVIMGLITRSFDGNGPVFITGPGHEAIETETE